MHEAAMDNGSATGADTTGTIDAARAYNRVGLCHAQCEKASEQCRSDHQTFHDETS
jgi:hypothetical protein